MTDDYSVLLTPDDNGTWLVTCPDLPELARRHAVHGPHMDRLLELRHSSRISSLENALHRLGKRVVVSTA